MNDVIKEHTESNNSQKKILFKQRYRFIILLLLFSALTGYIYYIFTWKSDSQMASEKTIREIAAAELNKDPDKLTDKDFAKITDLELTFVTYPDIKLLSKFVNLQHLHISRDYPDHNPWLPNPIDNTSKIETFLEKLDIKNASHKKYIDLNPLKKLSKLETLNIDVTANNIKPLAYLSNLEVLEFSGGTSSYNLQGKFAIEREYLNVKPLGKLSNLKKLSLAGYSIKNTEAIAKLKNLKELHLLKQLPHEENKYLQKTLPDLKIIISNGGSPIHDYESLSDIPLTPKNEPK